MQKNVQKYCTSQVRNQTGIIPMYRNKNETIFSQSRNLSLLKKHGRKNFKKSGGKNFEFFSNFLSFLVIPRVCSLRIQSLIKIGQSVGELQVGTNDGQTNFLYY